jgi:hypothetical protein
MKQDVVGTVKVATDIIPSKGNQYPRRNIHMVDVR